MPSPPTSSLPTLLFLTQIASTLFMNGLIWFVQIVHYPLFSHVGPRDVLQRYGFFHANRTGYVVFPPMLLELASSLAALYPPLRTPLLSDVAATSLAALVLFIWLSTGLIQVPLHNALQKPLPEAGVQKTIHRLVTSNWLRTAAWTLRAVILVYVLASAFHR